MGILQSVQSQPRWPAKQQRPIVFLWNNQGHKRARAGDPVRVEVAVLTFSRIAVARAILRLTKRCCRHPRQEKNCISRLDPETSTETAGVLANSRGVMEGPSYPNFSGGRWTDLGSCWRPIRTYIGQLGGRVHGQFGSGGPPAGIYGVGMVHHCLSIPLGFTAVPWGAARRKM